jgi:hypothetical protein
MIYDFRIKKAIVTKMKIGLYILLIALFTNTLAKPHEISEDDKMLLTLAHKIFEQSLEREKDQSTIQSALHKFKLLLEADPKNPLFLVYQGSTYTLMSEFAWLPWSKKRYTNEGLEKIKMALQQLKTIHDSEYLKVGEVQVPISIETRLVAIDTFLRINDPQSINVFEAVKAVLYDLYWSPAFQKAPPSIQAHFYLQNATLAHQENKPCEQEKQHLDKSSKIIKKAEKKLKNWPKQVRHKMEKTAETVKQQLEKIKRKCEQKKSTTKKSITTKQIER